MSKHKIAYFVLTVIGSVGAMAYSVWSMVSVPKVQASCTTLGCCNTTTDCTSVLGAGQYCCTRLNDCSFTCEKTCANKC